MLSTIVRDGSGTGEVRTKDGFSQIKCESIVATNRLLMSWSWTGAGDKPGGQVNSEVSSRNRSGRNSGVDGLFLRWFFYWVNVEPRVLHKWQSKPLGCLWGLCARCKYQFEHTEYIFFSCNKVTGRWREVKRLVQQTNALKIQQGSLYKATLMLFNNTMGNLGCWCCLLRCVPASGMRETKLITPSILGDYPDGLKHI